MAPKPDSAAVPSEVSGHRADRHEFETQDSLLSWDMLTGQSREKQFRPWFHLLLPRSL